MSENRRPVKLDFISGLEKLPPRPKIDASTTQASVSAGREVGFSDRGDAGRSDGRRLRSRGANTQLNLKVTAEEKEAILQEAVKMIRDPQNPISSLGEFVVHAVTFFREQQMRSAN